MPPTDQKSTAQSAQPTPKKAPPVTVREVRVGFTNARLKRWENGEHSIELSQKTRFTTPEGKAIYHQVTIGEHEASAISDVLMSFRSLAAHVPSGGR